MRRTPAKIAGDAEDYFLVSIQTAGQGVVSQDGRDARLGPGDFALYDSTRPYTLRFDGAFQQFVLKLPGRTLRTRVRETQHLTATAVSGACGAGHLMLSMIQTLATDIDTLAPECAAAVADSVTHILSAGLSTLPKRFGVVGVIWSVALMHFSLLVCFTLLVIKRRNDRAAKISVWPTALVKSGL